MTTRGNLALARTMQVATLPPLGALLAGLGLACLVACQAKPVHLGPAGDWQHFNRDAGSSRYSPLDQIDVANVASLELAWQFPDAESAAKSAAAASGNSAIARVMAELNIAVVTSGVSIKAVPVVVNGRMFVPANDRVYALDAATGARHWEFKLPEGRVTSQWGVNYWPGTQTVAPRIFFTAENQLFGLRAEDGAPVEGFGEQGVVDLGVPWRGVPVVVGDVIAVGANVLETPQDPGAAGDTRGFDAVTGELRWVFKSVPGPGQVGHDTWLDEGWRDRSGTNVWGPHMTVDNDLGLLYLPIGGPASNYYGGDRPGANLFGNSIVAIDGATGEYRWHFQLVHHDIWDYDNPPAPVLLNLRRGLTTVPVLAQVGKSGYMFILDRRTGEPVFGVEERPVPPGDVPGEWYAPTQPFPVKPGPLAKVSFDPADIVSARDTTAVHAANCRALYEEHGGFYNDGPFTPFLLQGEAPASRVTIGFPGAAGGTNWGGMATSQSLGYVFAYAQNLGSIGWTMKKEPGKRYPSIDEARSDLPYTRASHRMHGPHDTFSASAGEGLGTYPCQKPPWGQLSAVDANTGEIVWQVPVGVAKRLPEGKQDTGLPRGTAGPTATAGGLVFYAGLSDGLLRAFDASNGEQLWQTELPSAAITQPISYLGSDGRQYVAISVAGTVTAFALPAQ